MIHIADILIVLFMLIFLFKGYGNGILKEGVSFVGNIVIIVAAFFLKNPVSVLLYKNLPFFNLKGILSGISVLNVIIYELIAFVLVLTILALIYSLVLRLTNILDRIATNSSVVEIPSKILGMIVGIVEGVIFNFVMLFICLQLTPTKEYVENSSLASDILTKTPVLSKVVEPTYNSIKEISDVCDNYKDSTDRNAANLEVLDILLKYKVITYDNAKYLIDSGKLNIIGYESVLDKYKYSNDTNIIS